MRKPVAPTMCSGVFVAAQSRAMFPVFCGISGSTKATRSIVFLRVGGVSVRTHAPSRHSRRAGLVPNFIPLRIPRCSSAVESNLRALSAEDAEDFAEVRRESLQNV